MRTNFHCPNRHCAQFDREVLVNEKTADAKEPPYCLACDSPLAYDVIDTAAPPEPAKNEGFLSTYRRDKKRRPRPNGM